MNYRANQASEKKYFPRILMVLTSIVIFLMLSALVARTSYAAQTTLVPVGVVGTGGWAGVTAGNLSDGADATYSTITGALDTFTVSLSTDAAYSGATINSVTVYVRASVVGGAGGGERITFGSTAPVVSTSAANNLTDEPTRTDYPFPLVGIVNSGDVDALEIAVNTTTLGGGEEARIFDVWAVVDYTAAAVPNEVTTCDACHTQPPVEEASRNGATGAVVGSHASHNTYTCTVCHPNNVVLNHRGAGAGDTGGQIEMLANIQGGSYAKGVAFTQANDLTGAGLGACSDVSCHGGASSTSPQWGNNGTLACDSCHALPPATNAHTTHYTSKGWAPGVETNCTACHPDNTAGHSDVTDGSVIVNAGLTPSGASPAISCGNAPALGCHNGKATPNWNASGITCLQCHTAGGTDPADPTTGLHDETPTVSGVIHNPSDANFSSCEDCHTANPSDNHWDGTAQNSAPIINFDAGVTGFTDGTPATCASSCHSESAASEAWDRKWHEDSDQTNGTECAGCHGDWTNGWNGSVLHRSDADPQSTHGTGTNYECKDCHGLEGAANYSFTISSNDWGGGSNHGNDLITINQNGHTFGRSGGLSGCAPCHAQYDGTDGAANQHSFTTTGWNLDLINGDTINAGCDSCHGGGGQSWPNGAVYPDRIGRHDEHMTQLATNLGITLPGTEAEQKRMCEYCHNDAGGVGGSGHSADGGGDSTSDVGAFNPIWDTTNPASVNDAGSAYAPDSCNSIACHNNKDTGTATYGWYAAGANTCTMCHTESGNGGAEIADPTSGLHDVTPTISGQRHGDAMGCVNCHTATPSADHIGGTVGTPNFAGSVGYTGGATPTCANACHAEDAMGTNWAHLWHENTGNATASCQGCHGDWTNGWNSGVRHRTTASTQSTHGGAGTYGCADCHAMEAGTGNYTFTFGGSDWGGASNHGNGFITMNDDGGGTITDWQRGAGGNSAKSICIKCHTDWADNPPHWFVNTSWPPEEITGDGINASCTGCHGGGAPAAGVSDASPHAAVTGYACEECHTGHGAGTIEIPNNTAVGIDYTGNGEGGIALGGSATSGSTQAEICWNCHGGAHSEWGTNTGGSYDYGSVTTSNWSTATWASANFGYKGGVLDTPPGGQARASFHDTGRTWPGASTDAVADVSCSYCHDVHDTMGPNGKPYLRGAWNPNPYPEDGAPRAGDAYSGTATPYGDVPRGNTGNTGPGAFQIDQNNGNPNSGVGTNLAAYTSTDGLCELCHDAATLTSQSPLHKNPVKYFSVSYNDNSAARNIFKQSDRSSANTRFDPAMGYQGTTGLGDAGKGWMGGLRNKDFDTGIAVPPTIGGRYGYQTGNFEWGVTMNSTTVDVDYHQFTCSKCHTPHASRLPRLMITNCLDTQLNTWDDDDGGGPAADIAGSANWSNWPNVTPGNNKQLSQSGSAQNCHRETGEASGPGWNSVTPW